MISMLGHPYPLPQGYFVDLVLEVMSHIRMLRFYLSQQVPKGSK